MKRIPLNLKDHQHELLRKWSFEQKKSISEIIRRLIDEKRKEGRSE